MTSTVPATPLVVVKELVPLSAKLPPMVISAVSPVPAVITAAEPLMVRLLFTVKVLIEKVTVFVPELLRARLA